MNEKENTASNRVNTVEIKRLIPVDDAKYNIERVHLKNRRTKKARRSSALVIPSPVEKQEESLVINNNQNIFDEFVLYDHQAKNSVNALECLEKMKDKFMSELNDYLLKSSEKMMYISRISTKFSQMDYYEKRIQKKNMICIFLYHNMVLKLYHKNVKFLQHNIREIFMFKDYLETKNPLPKIDLDSFLKKRILQKPREVDRINKNLITFKNKMDMMKSSIPECISPFLEFVSIKNKSGRIIRKYYNLIDQLEYEDLEVILNSIVPDKEHYKVIREFLFDLAWEKLIFPFADVEIMNLPNIFDLTPKIFSPKFLSDKVINTPFSELNSIDWPFKDLSNDLFLLLIERDPFIVAEKFWSMSCEYTQIAIILAKEYHDDDCEIGFDLIFSYFLIAIFAFGVSEILEVMKFSYSFIDFIEPNDTIKLYSMTYFEALVNFITQINSEEYHKKYH